MTLRAQYYKAILHGNNDRAYAIEIENGLDGYSPEIVSVGLEAIDFGRDPTIEIKKYIKTKEKYSHGTP